MQEDAPKKNTVSSVFVMSSIWYLLCLCPNSNHNSNYALHIIIFLRRRKRLGKFVPTKCQNTELLNSNYDHIQSKATEIAKKNFTSIPTKFYPQVNDLSDEEKEQLRDYEKIIEDNEEGFFKVAMALCRINKLRLYRGTHRRFYDYVAERWGHGKTWAYQKINEAEMLGKITVTLGTTPRIENSSALAILAGLSDADMANVILRATDLENGGMLSAKNLRIAKGRCEKEGVISKPRKPEYTRKPKKVINKDWRVQKWVGNLTKMRPYLTEKNTNLQFRKRIRADLNSFICHLSMIDNEMILGSKTSSQETLSTPELVEDALTKVREGIEIVKSNIINFLKANPTVEQITKLKTCLRELSNYYKSNIAAQQDCAN